MAGLLLRLSVTRENFPSQDRGSKTRERKEARLRFQSFAVIFETLCFDLGHSMIKKKKNRDKEKELRTRMEKASLALAEIINDRDFMK